MEIIIRVNTKIDYQNFVANLNKEYDIYKDENLNVIHLDFSVEKIKNKLGKHMKETIKNIHTNNKNNNGEYNHLELKYKIGRDIESLNFEKIKDKFDYRKYFNYDYLYEFKDIFTVESLESEYFRNRLFFGRCYIHKSKNYITNEKINNLKMDKERFILFCFSKPIYKYEDVVKSNYIKVFSDFTNRSKIPIWMKLDTLYMFNIKKFRNFTQNRMMPYHNILTFYNFYEVELVDCKRCSVRISEKVYDVIDEDTNLKNNQTVVFTFSNIIEGYKFYSYCTFLLRNQHEFVNSLKYTLYYNLGIGLIKRSIIQFKIHTFKFVILSFVRRKKFVKLF